jgi:phosphonate transport system ATP-binding protein
MPSSLPINKKTIIEAKSVYKSYAGSYALKNVSFKIDSSDSTVILGPSGAGKSTLFRCIAKTEKPDRGKVILNTKKIGIVFQQFHLFEIKN